MLEIIGEVTVLVTMYQGIIDSVCVYQDSDAAEDAFRLHTAVTWQEYLYRTGHGVREDAEMILGDTAGTMLYEVDLE